MMPGMNSRQMQSMMRKMGIVQQEIDAVQVIIRTPNEELVFEHPQVSKVNMMGQETYQVVGTPQKKSIDSTPDISSEDINAVMAQTQVGEEQAREALVKHKGDIAAAILEFGSE